jgi:hypothetical protein
MENVSIYEVIFKSTLPEVRNENELIIYRCYLYTALLSRLSDQTLCIQAFKSLEMFLIVFMSKNTWYNVFTVYSYSWYLVSTPRPPVLFATPFSPLCALCSGETRELSPKVIYKNCSYLGCKRASDS